MFTEKAVRNPIYQWYPKCRGVLNNCRAVVDENEEWTFTLVGDKVFDQHRVIFELTAMTKLLKMKLHCTLYNWPLDGTSRLKTLKLFPIDKAMLCSTPRTRLLSSWNHLLKPITSFCHSTVTIIVEGQQSILFHQLGTTWAFNTRYNTTTVYLKQSSLGYHHNTQSREPLPLIPILSAVVYTMCY